MVGPNEVKAEAKRLEEQNYKFRTFLKIHADDDELDAQFLELHKELFADYDCCQCRNCCKAYNIILDQEEVEKIAAFLGMAESDFIAKYLTNTEPNDEKPYKIKEKPCLFLCENGSCQIEGCKPDDCAGYPYTNRPDRLSSMLGIVDHAEVCPVVFEMLERLKVMYGFRNRV
jgi:hypothetical protein